MESILKDVFSSIPLYFKNFIAVLTSPVRFPYQKAQTSTDEEETKELTQALTFFAITIVICAFFGYLKINLEDKPYENLARLFFSEFLSLVFGVFLVQLSCMIMGGKAKFMKYVIGYCYQLSVGYVSLQIVTLLTQGFIKMDDPLKGEAIVELWKSGLGMPSGLIESMSWGPTLFYLTGILAFFVWGFAGMKYYMLINNLSKTKYFFSLLISFVLTIGYLYLVMFIQMGIVGDQTDPEFAKKAEPWYVNDSAGVWATNTIFNVSIETPYKLKKLEQEITDELKNIYNNRFCYYSDKGEVNVTAIYGELKTDSVNVKNFLEGRISSLFRLNHRDSISLSFIDIDSSRVISSGSILRYNRKHAIRGYAYWDGNRNVFWLLCYMDENKNHEAVFGRIFNSIRINS